MDGFMNPQRGHSRVEGGGGDSKQNWGFVECKAIIDIRVINKIMK